MSRRPNSKRGFTRAVTLMQPRIRAAGKTRGFEVTRLLTHWAEIVGPDLARGAQPVKVGYGSGGIGATLTVLAQGAIAPMVEMQAPLICEKVNACYGYNAISRVRVTQTAPTGFAEPPASFAPAAKRAPAPTPEIRDRATGTTEGVQDDALRAALTDLAALVITKNQTNRRPS